jgi:hypothetical protein
MADNAKIYKMVFADVYPAYIQKVHYLDKLIDELAKGKPLEKILRQ